MLTQPFSQMLAVKIGEKGFFFPQSPASILMRP